VPKNACSTVVPVNIILIAKENQKIILLFIIYHLFID